MHNRRSFYLMCGLLILILLLVACREIAPSAQVPPLALSTPESPSVVETPTTSVAAEPTSTLAPTVSLTVAPTPTRFYEGPLSPVCGLQLPPLPGESSPLDTAIEPDPEALTALRAAAPAIVWPAIQRILDAPGSVGLALYQVGQANNGVYWNADSPMPLASVAKIIVLVAYVEAVAAEELNPLSQVPLAELERYYLPNFDLGAHRRSINELRENGRVIAAEGDNPAVYLEDVAWMMIRHSSNAASDYLHQLLGQERIETTAITLGLDAASGQSAPCAFLGQFLIMANHTRAAAGDRTALLAYLAGDDGPAAYGQDVSLLFDAFSNSATFRDKEALWRSSTRRPAIDTQRLYAGRLSPQGTARGYADLMARLAQNGLSNPDSSYLARRILEWPMQFPVNQSSFSNLGYKNGSLPGVLNSAYYGYRLGESAPVVIALFYRDLPQQTYRRWRFDLPHDELARWLLADPQAIPLIRAVLNPPDA